MCCKKELKSLQVVEHSCPSQGCPKTFANAYNLRRHMTTNHVGLKRYGCAECRDRFLSYKELKAHEKAHNHSATSVAKEAACLLIDNSPSGIGERSAQGRPVRMSRLQSMKVEVIDGDREMSDDEVSSHDIAKRDHIAVASSSASTSDSTDTSPSSHDSSLLILKTESLENHSKLLPKKRAPQEDLSEHLQINLLCQLPALPAPMFDRKLPIPYKMAWGLTPQEVEVDSTTNCLYINPVLF